MKFNIFGTEVNNLSEQYFLDTLTTFAQDEKKKSSMTVCFANVHMVMEGNDNYIYQEMVNNADFVVPDGMPLVWHMNLFGDRRIKQERISGPDTTLKLCKIAQEKQIKVGFFGSSEEIMNKMIKNLKLKYPQIVISLTITPPFRELTETEINKYREEINNSEVEILFVGLGCPKQEKWMFENREHLKCLLLGVGAAFDFISGEKQVAPLAIQKMGMEWLYRLFQEPKRLWKRYLKHNPRFIYMTFKYLANIKGRRK